MNRHNLITAILMAGALLHACAGLQSKGTGAMAGGTLVTPGLFDKITGIEWQLTKMTLDTKSINLVVNSQTTLTCSADGRVSGVATLNRYSGILKLQPDGEIVWNKAFIMTRMAGPPELMQQEANFTQALMKMSRMFLNEPILTLQSQDGATVLEFQRAK